MTKLENESLILDLVEWISRQPRPYAEVMDAWRTSCPRFPIWEDAVGHGLIVRVERDGLAAAVEVTPVGLEFLRLRDRK